MDIHKRALADGSTRWRVRWRQAGRYRVRTFDRKGDAIGFAVELRRRQQLGTVSSIDASRIILADYVAGTWATTYRAHLSESTRLRYGYLYDKHILPELGFLSLRELTPEVIARWQADCLAKGGGPTAVRSALTLLGGILQRAVEAGHLQSNPARAVRKASIPPRAEVRPLLRTVVEQMRRASGTSRCDAAERVGVCGPPARGSAGPAVARCSQTDDPRRARTLLWA